MPAPLSIAIRRQIIERHTQGESLVAISGEMQLSYHTVKRMWRHWRRYGKLEPNYEQARQRGTRKYPQVRAAAVQMKRHHPGWGAGLIRLQVAEQQWPEGLPSSRTLQRWFREAGVGKSPKVRVQRVGTVKRGQAAHEVWAVDAKEQIPLANSQSVSWLTVTDEGSGAVLDATAFPPTPVVGCTRADRPAASAPPV